MTLASNIHISGESSRSQFVTKLAGQMIRTVLQEARFAAVIEMQVLPIPISPENKALHLRERSRAILSW